LFRLRPSVLAIAGALARAGESCQTCFSPVREERFDETLRFRCRHRPRRIVDGWRVREEGPGAAATRSNGSAGGDQAGAAAAPTTAAAGAEAASADRRRAVRQEVVGAAQRGEAA